MRALVSRLGILLPAAVLSVSVSLVATIPSAVAASRASAPAASAGVRRLTVNQSLSPTAFISKETRVIHELVRMSGPLLVFGHVAAIASPTIRSPIRLVALPSFTSMDIKVRSSCLLKTVVLGI